MGPLMRDVVAPAPELGIEIVDIAKGPRGEEGIAEVADLPLDFPLLIAAAGRARPRREVIVAGEVEQARMKSNRGALAFEHRRS